MDLTKCASCGTRFLPRPQSPEQRFCSKTDCQRERRRRWQRAKRASDPDYRLNDRAAAEAWRQAHPDYWRRYQRPRLTSEVPGGLYRLEILANPQCNENVWIVRLVPSRAGNASSRRAK